MEADQGLWHFSCHNASGMYSDHGAFDQPGFWPDSHYFRPAIQIRLAVLKNIVYGP